MLIRSPASPFLTLYLSMSPPCPSPSPLLLTPLPPLLPIPPSPPLSADYQSHPFFQPYELLDDVMKEERRTYALDMLRYMRISGFELLRSGAKITNLTQVSVLVHKNMYPCMLIAGSRNMHISVHCQLSDST